MRVELARAIIRVSEFPDGAPGLAQLFDRARRLHPTGVAVAHRLPLEQLGARVGDVGPVSEDGKCGADPVDDEVGYEAIGVGLAPGGVVDVAVADSLSYS
jgi:hypothetical protein